ncbi:MAG: sensor histidine kinase [Chloroflexota bacterium]|nr:sensor histidine kinase [Chloroflexota bacterium]
MIPEELSTNQPQIPARAARAVRSYPAAQGTGSLLSRLASRFPGRLTGAPLSIRSKILVSFIIIILLMVLVNTVLLVRVWQYTHQYDRIITNIITANNINGYIKPAIDTEMWNIVAGKTTFEEGSQYQIIDEVNHRVGEMIANSDSDKARIKLEVILRTMDTLTHYVDMMGTQIAQGSTVAENENVLENVRGVSDVVEESVQEYMLFEVNRAEQNYNQTQQRFIQWALVFLVLTLCVTVFSFVAAWLISRNIYAPIKKLHDVTTTIAQNDLQVLMAGDNADEITELGMSFNIMIGRIRELLDAKVKEQENLKKSELRALQAQINPHFLYNTLDTIIWMAEARKTEEVVEIVGALSSFFRISLSKGEDWIPLRDEIQHVQSYLIIQKMRYRDILDYSIEVDPGILDCTVLKLMLQPLVENALYHGIKNRRAGGRIVVRGRRLDGDQIRLEVADDGAGFTSYKLTRVLEEIEGDGETDGQRESGFGLGNVNRRVKLYYGRQYGVSIDSEYGVGTRAAILIPARTAAAENN